MEPRAVSGAATMKLVVTHAKYDFAQLQALASRVTNDKNLRTAAKASHAMVSEWYPDPVTDKVVIGFTKVTAAERAEVRAEYGSLARVITAPTGYVAVGEASVVAKEVRPSSRTSASAPWYGGEELDYNYGDASWVCSSGFEFGNDSLSTAGHCGVDPSTFYNDNAYVGTTDTLQFGNGRIDMQRIGGGSYTPYVWAGASGNTKEPVSGSGGVAIGGTYCTDGYVTGQNCTAIVYAIDVCVNLYFDIFKEYVDDCDQDYAASSNLTSISLPGDSGGPVYTKTSIYGPYAVGTITGEGSDDGAYAYWGDMYEEKVIFHLSPEVG